MPDWVRLSDLLELGHPSLPASERGLRKLAAERWRGDPARFRLDGGEHWYHASLLPAEVRAVLAARETRTSPLWAGFEGASKGVRDEAARRLEAVTAVAELRRGMALTAAVEMAAERCGVSPATLRGWLRLVKGVARADWLPALAPRHKGRVVTAECDPRAWEMLVADYLRPACPAFTACFERMREAAAAHGWAPIPAERTLRRRLEREVPRASRVLGRAGLETARRTRPQQRRDRSVFGPCQAVNADGHTFDVFVTAPWRDKPFRPVLVAVQDLFSGKILGWRLGESECWPLVRLAFLDVLRSHGVPEAAYLDNGRAFASKWMTGGQLRRFRFKVKEGEPEGLLTSVGMVVHWATPYHGQAKPIERAFGDLCETIAKHPACAGAYTGNSPMAKPEDYGRRALGWDAFHALVAGQIARHNARPGRRGGSCAGRSFDETYAAAAEGAVIAKASAGQLRMFALAADKVRARAPSGEVHLAGNRYWAEPLVEVAGRDVTVRFDPEALHSGVSVFRLDGAHLCEAACIEATGFNDAEAAARHARQTAEYMRRVRAGLEAERRMTPAQVAALLPDAPAPAPAPEPAAVRMVAGGGRAPAPAEDAAPRGFSRAIEMLERGVLRFPGHHGRE